jgi:hypothetical protein
MEDTEPAVQIPTGNISKHSEGKQMDNLCCFPQRQTAQTEWMYENRMVTQYDSRLEKTEQQSIHNLYDTANFVVHFKRALLFHLTKLPNRKTNTGNT